MNEALSIIFGVVGLIVAVAFIISSFVTKRKKQLAQANKAGKDNSGASPAA